MDLNQSMEFNTSLPTPQVQNFVSMPSFMPCHQTEENCEQARQFRFLQVQKHNLELFWNQQLIEINNTTVFKNNHHLPLARIKRVMKSDGNVKMISADTPILFSKACELFILELTLRAWLQTEECKRRTLQRCDIARALRHGSTFNFLVDAIPYTHNKDQETENHGDIDSLPTIQLSFPMMDINGDLIMKNYEVPQEFMTKEPMPSIEFSYQSAPKGTGMHVGAASKLEISGKHDLCYD